MSALEEGVTPKEMRKKMLGSRLPLPDCGLDIPAGSPVRVVTKVRQIAGVEVESTELSWTRREPEEVEGKWVVEIVGVGVVPAGRVRRA